MEKLILSYIAAHDKAWAESSKRSELHRLRSVAPLINGNPSELWTYFETKQLGKYSRVTYWTRVCDFYDWMLKNKHVQGSNPYREWRDENALQFKHAYERKLPDISYSEAKRRIETIPDTVVRQKCLQLLDGGLRYTESFTVVDRHVIGKGGKRRKVYTDLNPEYRKSYTTLLRHLRGLGLKPHALRKLAATEFRRRGLKDEDLLKVMGWSSMSTAQSYLIPLTEEEIEKKLKG